jgi:hypothetical protein
MSMEELNHFEVAHLADLVFVKDYLAGVILGVVIMKRLG